MCSGFDVAESKKDVNMKAVVMEMLPEAPS